MNTTTYLRRQIDPVTTIEVCRRVDDLVSMGQVHKQAQTKVKDIMNGGSRGLRALVGRTGEKDVDMLDSLPAGNPMLSGITHLSTKLQQVPDLRVTPHRDTDVAKRAAETREKILWHLDEACALESQMPQVGLWMPGYGYAVWVLTERRGPNGDLYPHAELRNPLEAFPGDFGVDQQPPDIAFVRHISVKELVRRYPQHARVLVQAGVASDGVALPPVESGSTWATQRQGIKIAEYYDHRGCWWVVPERNLLLEYRENPLSVPMFTIAKRFAFDELQGQYDHVIGLMAMQARLSVMQAQFLQDNIHSEALELSTPIPTPSGWTTMGELRDGDMILGADGRPTEVLEAKPVQLDRDCYRVTFEDGSSVVASDGHLWMSRGISNRRERVRTTEEMFNSRDKFRIPASKPWKLPEADLPIDPYLFGVWLGDGSSASAYIGQEIGDMKEIVAHLEAADYTVRWTSNGAGFPMIYVSTQDAVKGSGGSGLKGILRVEGFLNNKHISKIYLRGSIDQRLALVQGLMDTDGHCQKDGYCVFVNTNRKLIDGLVELLRSLGEVPHVVEVDGRHHLGDKSIWRVHFKPRNFNPFRLTRKAARVRFHNRGPEWVTIKSIEKVDSVPVRCIAVDNDDHLFLAGQGAHVTHNTNIYGPAPATYRKGRFAINELDQGTRVEKVVNNMPFQAFQAIDRIERQLRTTARYPVTDDAQSPTSWATGAGLEELGSSQTLEVRTYQTQIRRSIEALDAMRLEWEERRFGDRKRTVVGEYRGERYVETYKPAQVIGGAYKTRRKFGFMAGWDESRKLVGGLQLVAAGIIPKAVMRENLDGLDDSLTRVEELLDAERAETVLQDTLLQMAQQGDPRALEAVIRMMPAGETRRVLESVFMPEEEMAPQEAPLPEQPPGLEELFANPQMLARMGQDGGVNGGGMQVMQEMAG